MLTRSTIQLLRFPFSVFLAPVYLFALSQLDQIHWPHAVLVGAILHLLVYPASNGYNSYMDRDEGPIGGLANPMQPTRQLFYVTMTMDVLALLLGLLISTPFSACVLLYILASRAYSWRRIRLKQYPVIGFLTVILFQGGLTFFMVYTSCGTHFSPSTSHLPPFNYPPSPIPYTLVVIACLLIGGFYPLTQIYQHDADRKDGVRTISMMLGLRGTFVFCGIVYSLAMGLMAWVFNSTGQIRDFFIIATLLMPVVLYFLNWARKVWNDPLQANFNNTMRMNVVASLCTSTAFIFVIILRSIE
jgi:1,4-dihydroxy-2-naphthoate octaprenyltransferase